MVLRTAKFCHVARMVARCALGFVGILLLLVDNEQAEVLHGRKDGAARADDDARKAGADALPLIITLRERKAAVQDSDRITEVRRKRLDHLRRQRDLGHKHAGRTAGRQHAFNRREVDLSFAGTGDAIDKDNVAMSVQTGALNLRERLLLAVCKRDRCFAAYRGQRGLLAAATPGATLLHHDDTTFFERLDGRRHAVVEQVEVARCDRAAL